MSILTPGPQTVIASAAVDALRFQRYRLSTSGPAGDALSEGGQTFDRREITIGSAPDNDLVIEHPTVSRVHARLTYDGDGYKLTDLNSKNGTWINGLRIEAAYLPNAAQLLFGQRQVAFTLTDQAVEVDVARGDQFGRLLGSSTRMREVFAMLAKVARSDVSILIEGESGTGKELAAEAIQQNGHRRDKPFIIFDCSAVPPELIESELFGHVRGAFTGAITKRAGVFEAADGGTLFLDEVGELPLELQPKLLRALEKGEFKPVGGNERRIADVRIIAATNRQLDNEVEGGGFREDLYYRLAVIKIRLPALRQRPDDIPQLVNHFLKRAQGGETGGVQVSWETMQRLAAHPWPGNVRELKNYVERAVVLADHGRLETRHLGTRGIKRSDAVSEIVSAGEDGEAGADGSQGVFRVDFDLPFKDAKSRLLQLFETRYWRRLLKRCDENVSEAARQGGIHRKSLEYLVKKLELRG